MTVEVRAPQYQGIRPRSRIEMWICPSCSHAWGGTTIIDLSAHENHDLKGQTVGTRDECPDCRSRGLTVHKELYQVVMVRKVGH